MLPRALVQFFLHGGERGWVTSRRRDVALGRLVRPLACGRVPPRSQRRGTA
jgi:hypothetical protein